MRYGLRNYLWFLIALCFSMPFAAFAETPQMQELQSALLKTDSVSSTAFHRVKTVAKDKLSEERKNLVGRSDTAAQKNRQKLAEFMTELPVAVSGVAPKISEFGTQFDFSRKQFETLVRHLENILKSKKLNEISQTESTALFEEMKTYQQILTEEKMRYLHEIMAYPDYLKQSIAILKEHQQALENFRDFLIHRQENPYEAETIFRVVLEDVKTPRIPKYVEPVSPLIELRENSARLREWNKKLQAEMSGAETAVKK